MKIQLNRLNDLELRIHQQLTMESQEKPNLTITEAARLTEVSPSKISKLVKKMGFSGYKEYFRFLTGKELVKRKRMNSEFARIQEFMENFDESAVDYLVDLIQQSEKILLFGYGPTNFCMEYFEYKLNFTLNKNVIRVSQPTLIPDLLTKDSLLLIFSVAGKFASFDPLFEEAKKHHAKSLLVMEELNTDLSLDASEIIFLTKSHQDEQLKSHEKTRTILLMFIEEVIRKLSKEDDRD
ncbi:MurR/RpiR family transcriptional regulator [Enterococcus sp. DIV0756]|uniref:MurR/RpiR family transcriptional regulator n=1 Tax=Enterococcus sp. DIV0756 TaxID=2774636 RepID=UPI003F250F61